jgi:hypothetical protein
MLLADVLREQFAEGAGETDLKSAQKLMGSLENLKKMVDSRRAELRGLQEEVLS